MTKRKLNLRQQTRIAQAQDQLLEHSADTQTGLVICRHGKRALIETTEGQLIDCLIRPNVPMLVAGDKIAWQALNEMDAGIIVSCYPRETVLSRLDKHSLAKPLAANLTQLIIVFAPQPAITWSLIDSYLVTAELLNLQACLVLNKTDLLSDESRAILDTHYVSLGYPVFYTSRQQPESYVALEKHLATQVSIFVGQSGVGKSSLIATFLPHVADEIQTSPLSNQQFGQHTTSYSRYYHLPHGGAIIDSPGVRSFQPPHLSTNLIIAGYRELKPLLGKCHFRNCSHCNTPGCALTQALENKQITEFRYNNFMKMLKLC
jgi:ribosome biogenesis GTPase / thiamine phosphate phosphatase